MVITQPLYCGRPHAAAIRPVHGAFRACLWSVNAPVDHLVVQVLNLKYILLHTPMVVGDLIELLAGGDWQDMSFLLIDISNACTALHCCTNWMVRSCALCG
jgi:hypothetical protein